MQLFITQIKIVQPKWCGQLRSAISEKISIKSLPNNPFEPIKTIFCQIYNQ